MLIYMEEQKKEKKCHYTLRHIRSLLEPICYDEERIMYVYYMLNNKEEEANECLDILNAEKDMTIKRFSNDNT